MTTITEIEQLMKMLFVACIEWLLLVDNQTSLLFFLFDMLANQVMLLLIYLFECFINEFNILWAAVMGERVGEEAERSALSLTEHDEHDEIPTPRDRPKFTSYIARRARDEIEGLEQDTVANRLIVKRWLRMAMVEHGVRPTHISALLPAALELAMVPTEEEIFATHLRASKAFNDRRRRFKSPKYSWSWRGLFSLGYNRVFHSVDQGR